MSVSRFVMAVGLTQAILGISAVHAGDSCPSSRARITMYHQAAPSSRVVYVYQPAQAHQQPRIVYVASPAGHDAVTTNQVAPRPVDQPAANLDLVDTAVKAGNFKTLAAALQAAGLVETLKGAGPFTVFAPTDEAFAKLPQGTVENLLKPENKDQLINILTYHVVKGRVSSRDAVTAGTAATIQGGPIQAQIQNGRLTVNNANVVATDINTSNGVIHVIDTVLLPR